ncbi:helix-turn-helix domain-containing protein [Bifidobacterium bifidum]|uniref:helix-turn-helix domain-containing protein n=1 Tax=Bifidobacterium bifidum TaxID=1681 RepID=UPI0032DFEC9E
MKEPTFNGRVLLSMDVIEAARAGDPLALERVLRYYDRYINKICTRTLYDKDGLPHIEIDEYMKHRLQAKLVEAIVVKEWQRQRKPSRVTMNTSRPWRLPSSLLCGNQAGASRNPLAPTAIMVFVSTHLAGKIARYY